MTTYIMPNDGRFISLTENKKYKVIEEDEFKYRIVDDEGFAQNISKPLSVWTVIEEPDTPKTWGEMTDAEKGALLLAHHEGKHVEQWDFDSGVWSGCIAPFQVVASGAYRIKPEPVVGEVVLNAEAYNDGTYYFSAASGSADTHRVALPTLDGQLVTGEFANEDGMKVVIEEKK